MVIIIYKQILHSTITILVNQRHLYFTVQHSSECRGNLTCITTEQWPSALCNLLTRIRGWIKYQEMTAWTRPDSISLAYFPVNFFPSLLNQIQLHMLFHCGSSSFKSSPQAFLFRSNEGLCNFYPTPFLLSFASEQSWVWNSCTNSF